MLGPAFQKQCLKFFLSLRKSVVFSRDTISETSFVLDKKDLDKSGTIKDLDKSGSGTKMKCFGVTVQTSSSGKQDNDPDKTTTLTTR
jgi:hypothetical protein